MHWFRYIPWLLWQVLLGAITIDKDAIRHSTHIQPTIIYYPLRIEKPWMVSAFAISITMTPGTMTIGIEQREDQQYLLVHSVWGVDRQAVIDDLADMEGRLCPAIAHLPLQEEGI